MSYLERIRQRLYIGYDTIKKAKLTIGIVFVELQSTLIPNFEPCFTIAKVQQISERKTFVVLIIIAFLSSVSLF